MILKNRFFILFVSSLIFFQSCGIYSFTGAAIEGKTINIHYIENNARMIVPSLSPTFTQKLRQRILSQSSLAQIDNENTDYDVSGNVTAYDVTVPALSGTETTITNRLTITVNIIFKNKLNPKADFTQNFTRFADFSASQNIQSVEAKLISDISDQLADDIFNKCFVNW